MPGLFAYNEFFQADDAI